MEYTHGKSLIKIAVADDHAMLRESMCQIIDTWENCKVILQADNGRQFMAQLDPKNLPDLALVDLRMPEINGYELIELLAKKYPEIKKMVLTLFIGEDAISRAFQAGAHGFMDKTEASTKLKKGIYEMMRTGHYFSDQSAARMVKQSLATGKKNKKNLNEEEILFLKNIITEKTYKQIASDMGIAVRHAEYLRNNMFERFDVQSRIGLAVQVIEKGLTV
jgi:two-component system, NarL family, invasion response regulator UvrY